MNTTGTMKVTCETPKCIDHAAKWGSKPSAYYLPTVPDHMPDVTHICQHCGGVYNGERWDHVCSKCGATVQPGELVGLFVPHLCQGCLDEQVKHDRKCSLCGKPVSLCCC